jgi:nucleoside-diphosphate-sugar epimerase
VTDREQAGIQNLSNATTQQHNRESKEIIVVTGGMGNIGHALVKRLVMDAAKTETQTKVRVMDIIRKMQHPLYHMFDAFTPPLDPNAIGFEYMYGDIRNISHIQQVLMSAARNGEEDVVGIVHLAAISQASRCRLTPQLCRDVNVGGTHNLLEVLTELTQRRLARGLSPPWLIYVSSYEVLA